ncbi:hypothetical protein ACIQUL_09000 [Streptomyces sp. NPDC090303]|uniref:hypothetical protein n=1 Tax=Streptomyces sp. NPDC090303 TaxID=3365960 RepID=UPI00380A7D98
MSTWSDIGTIGTAALSAVAAFGSWKAARRANDTSHSVARIEAERWRTERTPDVRLSLHHLGGGRFNLSLRLVGPDNFGDLEAVSVEVLNDDRDHRVLNPTAELTQADADAHVWGPFRFSPGIDGTEEPGRSTQWTKLHMGRGRPFAMDRTPKGHWMTGMSQANWQASYVGHPVRLLVRCRNGDDEWTFFRDLENPPLPQEA